MSKKINYYIILLVFLFPGCIQNIPSGSTPLGNIKSAVTGNKAKHAFETFEATGTLPPYTPDGTQKLATPSNNVFPDKSGNIVTVPPRSVVRWSAKGNCADPTFPAPRTGDKFRLIPASSLIPSEIEPLYRNFIRLTKTDQEARNHQQQIVWCMRTVSNKSSSYCDGMGDASKRVLDRALPGGSQLLLSIRQRQKVQQEALDVFRKIVPSVNVGGRNYNPVDLLSNPQTAQDAVQQQLQNLINMPINEAIQDTGYEYSEIAPGVFVKIIGDGTLSIRIELANTTSDPYYFDPTLYLAQPQRKAQRITLMPPSSVETLRSDDSKLKVPKPESPEGVIQVKTAQELVTALEYGALTKGAHIVIMNDISVSSWRPVFNFSGILDGRGHTITISTFGSSGSGEESGVIGFIGGISSGVTIIKNLNIKTSGSGFSFDASHSTQTISAFGGGLVGIVLAGEVNIENCSFDGAINVQSRGNTSGILTLIPWTATSIFQVIGSIFTSFTGDYILKFCGADYSLACGGGLIGKIGSKATVKITDSKTKGSVYSWASIVSLADKSQSYAGGLIGYSDSDNVHICRSKAGNTLKAAGDPLNILKKYTYTGKITGNNDKYQELCN
jgi:hypothetical protein